MTQPSTGETIRELRIDRGVRQAELARKVRCHPKHMSKIERGERNPSAVMLRRIAKALGVEVDDLLRQAECAAA